jgi:hypothetical protein
VTAVQLGDAGGADVETDDLAEAAAGQGQGQGEADIAEADEADGLDGRGRGGHGGRLRRGAAVTWGGGRRTVNER